MAPGRVLSRHIMFVQLSASQTRAQVTSNFAKDPLSREIGIDPKTINIVPPFRGSSPTQQCWARVAARARVTRVDLFHGLVCNSTVIVCLLCNGAGLAEGAYRVFGQSDEAAGGAVRKATCTQGHAPIVLHETWLFPSFDRGVGVHDGMFCHTQRSP